MARSKNMSINLANDLNQQGIPVIEKNYRDKTINPVSYYSPDKEKYKLMYTNYDMNQNISKYIWDKLPDGLSSWIVERMIYFRGSIAGFNYLGKVYILPWVMDGSPNIYGLPTNVRPITYNGRSPEDKEDVFFLENFVLPVNIKGDFTDKASAVILYDAVPFSPTGSPISRFTLNQTLISDIADTLARVNINIVVSNKKIGLIVKDPKQADIIRKELEIAFNSDSPFYVLTSELDATSPQSSSDFNASDLFNTIKNYDAMRCFMSGIASKNFGTDKKERLVSGELAGNEEQISLIADLGLQLRQEFCETCNKLWGTEMSVRKRADSYKEETNGNNKTKLEEEGEL